LKVDEKDSHELVNDVMKQQYKDEMMKEFLSE